MEDVDNFINGEGSQTDDDDVSNEETDTEEHSKGKENIRLRKLSPVTSASALLVHQKKPTTKSLVDNAITNLGERNGSSLIAIKKFIVLKNPSLDTDRLNGLIKRYIKKALEKGEMVQFKKRFKLLLTKSRPNKAEERAKLNNVNKKALLRNSLQSQEKGTTKATAAIRKKENNKANAAIKSPPKEKAKPKTKSTIKNRAKQDAATAKVQPIKHSKTDGNATPTKATNKKITKKLPRKSIIIATKATRSNIKTTTKVAPKKKSSVDNEADSKTGKQKKRK